MNKGDGIFSDDFFRTRPKRDKLHDFLEVAKPSDPDPEVTQFENHQPAVDFELHIAHQKKEEGIMFLHIPHRVSASRLTRKAHLVEGGRDSVSSFANQLTIPVRQVNKNSSSPMRLSTFEKAHKVVPKTALKLLKVIITTPPVYAQRVTPLPIDSQPVKNEIIRRNIFAEQLPVLQKKIIHIKLKQSDVKKIASPSKISSAKRSQTTSIVLCDAINNSRVFTSADVPQVIKQLPATRVMMRRSIRRTVRQVLPQPIPVPEVYAMPAERFPSTSVPVYLLKQFTVDRFSSASVPVIVKKLPTAKGMKRLSIRRTVRPAAFLPIPVPEVYTLPSGSFSAKAIPALPKQFPVVKEMMRRSIRKNTRRVVPLTITTPSVSTPAAKRLLVKSVPVLQQRQSASRQMLRLSILPQISGRRRSVQIIAIPEQEYRILKEAQEQRRKETAQAIQITIDTTRREFSTLGKLKPVAAVESPTVAQTPPSLQAQPKYVSPVTERFIPKKQKKKGLAIKKVIGEAARFAVTSAVIFGISFSVMNAPALSQLMMARLDPVSTAKQQIALENVVDTNSPEQRAPILPTAGMKRETHAVFPQLQIQPAPLENRIVIPKIGKNIPIVDVPSDSLLKSDWNKLEKDIQGALHDGVVRYPGTAEPGQIGNVFITGHSSYYLWDKGKFKDVFTRLHDLDVGDEFTIFWKQDIHHYRIRERKVVSPEETSVLKQPSGEKIATLMTCTPVGTAKDRLILVAEEI